MGGSLCLGGCWAVYVIGEAGICGWAFIELGLGFEEANSQTSDYNNDRFDKGSYSHQQPLDAEECRKCHSEAEARTTQQLFHRKLPHTPEQRYRHPNPPGRRRTSRRLPQTQSTPTLTQLNDNYLWSTLTAPNRSAFKDVVLNTLLDREKSIRRAAANVLFRRCRSLQLFAASRFRATSGKESPRRLPPTSGAKT